MEEVKGWQDRPLEALYPIVYLDALMVKMRQDGKVDNRAVYTARGHAPLCIPLADDRPESLRMDFITAFTQES